MKNYLLVTVAILSGVSGATASNAQPIQVVVPFLQSEHDDRLARLITPRSEPASKRPLAIENRPGNTGHHGAELVSRARNDGSTVLFAPIAYYAAERVMYQVRYDLLTEFSPVTTLFNDPQLLLVHPSIPSKTAGELIALAKSQPSKISWGAHRESELPELQVRMLRSLAAVQGEITASRDAERALSALMEGRTSAMFEGISHALPHIRAGKLRALATSGAKTAAMLPQIATLAQAGVKGYEADYWYAILAPEDTPAAIVNELRNEFVRALSNESVRKELLARGLETGHSTPAELAKLMQIETARWARVIEQTRTNK